MKTLKVLSIIGIILFGISFLALLGGLDEMESVLDSMESLGGMASIFGVDNELSDFTDAVYACIGLGFLCSLFGLAMSIYGVCLSCKHKQNDMPKMDQLHELNKLKLSGALTENEFEAKKRELLNN